MFAVSSMTVSASQFIALDQSKGNEIDDNFGVRSKKE
jgi:hypothetical protein